MIIKEKEFKDLKEELKNSKEKHKEEVKLLENKIKELEKAIKPDHININYFEYLENPYASSSRYSYSDRDFIKGKFEVNTSIVLSQGIVCQIHSLLSKIKKDFAEKYVKMYEIALKSIDKKVEEQIKFEKKKIALEILRILDKKNLFGKKEAIAKLTEFYES